MGNCSAAKRAMLEQFCYFKDGIPALSHPYVSIYMFNIYIYNMYTIACSPHDYGTTINRSQTGCMPFIPIIFSTIPSSRVFNKHITTHDLFRLSIVGVRVLLLAQATSLT